jgi:methyl-accepting chemotaxis protein
VKNLANQARQATDTISSEIDALNGIAGDVVGSLTAIKAAIAGVNEFIATTAAAVEEQSIVTEDMSSNMQRASAELAV